ncbi:MaoC family dehydratase [Pseudonocardia ailaonensis]|uniref:MaoC family dehydratase n=1 Tax=Pseudonocardia ailaonensis TaxID=367279 RepID=A0ABN2N334_9PSEU
MSAPTLLRAEELPVGTPIELGAYTVTRDEIVEFARAWDPQDFHVDEEVAAAGRFGGLIASGIQTLGVYQRLAVLGALRHWDVVAGRTLREIQLPAPVRPGMTLHGVLVVEEVAPTRPDMALVTQRGTLTADGRLRMELVCETYVRRLHAG